VITLLLQVASTQHGLDIPRTKGREFGAGVGAD
jgi:hypothetical protein